MSIAHDDGTATGGGACSSRVWTSPAVDSLAITSSFPFFRLPSHRSRVASHYCPKTMKIAAKFLLCALALVAVADASGNIRGGCDSGDNTPAPTTVVPGPTTPAPTTVVPGPTTPAPTTVVPGPTTPAPTTVVPGPTTPAPTTPEPTTPAPTTPAPTTPAPTTPAPTTPAPTTPAPTTVAPPTWKLSDSFYVGDNICAGELRVKAPVLDKLNPVGCAPGSFFNIKYEPTDKDIVPGCIVCDNLDLSLTKAAVPLCGSKPLCTKFYNYDYVTAADVLCVLEKNGTVDAATACELFDN